MSPEGEGEGNFETTNVYLRGGPYDGQIERVPIGTAILSFPAPDIKPRRGTHSLHRYSPVNPLELLDGIQVFAYGGITNAYLD